MGQYLLIAICFMSSVSFAFTETDLKKDPKPDDKQVRRLESQLDESAIKAEFEETDTYSYEAAAKGLEVEAKRLQKNTVQLEQQTKAAKAGKIQAKKEC